LACEFREPRPALNLSTDKHGSSACVKERRIEAKMTKKGKGGKEPISSPVTDKRREAIRALSEAIAGLIPVLGSFLSRLYRTTHPPRSEQDRKEWQVAISARTNENTDRLEEHGSLLAPKVTLTGVTAELTVVLAHASTDGMRGKARGREDLYALMPNAGPKSIDEAAFELKSYGLVEIQRAIGGHWWLHLTQQFYEQIDHQVMGWNSTTQEDARILGGLLLEDTSREWTPTLHAASGWERRRFNPAFNFILRFIPEERISGEVQPDYPARSVSLLPEDRVVLRQFVSASPARE
jgi:hypothetical protein